MIGQPTVIKSCKLTTFEKRKWRLLAVSLSSFSSLFSPFPSDLGEVGEKFAVGRVVSPPPRPHNFYNIGGGTISAIATAADVEGKISDGGMFRRRRHGNIFSAFGSLARCQVDDSRPNHPQWHRHFGFSLAFLSLTR
jgi:hypothetical protein